MVKLWTYQTVMKSSESLLTAFFLNSNTYYYSRLCTLDILESVWLQNLSGYKISRRSKKYYRERMIKCLFNHPFSSIVFASLHAAMLIFFFFYFFVFYFFVYYFFLFYFFFFIVGFIVIIIQLY